VRRRAGIGGSKTTAAGRDQGQRSGLRLTSYIHSCMNVNVNDIKDRKDIKDGKDGEGPVGRI